MTFALSDKSRSRMAGVHPKLCAVVSLAITISDIDFCVLEGVRTIERQRELVASGASQTMRSRHLTGHAVDLAAMVGGEVRWDWPLYHKLWGGDWKGDFKDGPHWQLPWREYP